MIVIDHGTAVYDGDLAGLHQRGGSTRTLVVDLVDEAPPIEIDGATTRRVEGPRQWLSFPADASAAPLVAAVAAAYDVADLSIQEPDIEDVIRELYSILRADRGRDLRRDCGLDAAGLRRGHRVPAQDQDRPVVVAARRPAR